MDSVSLWSRSWSKKAKIYRRWRPGGGIEHSPSTKHQTHAEKKRKNKMHRMRWTSVAWLSSSSLLSSFHFALFAFNYSHFCLLSVDSIKCVSVCSAALRLTFWKAEWTFFFRGTVGHRPLVDNGRECITLGISCWVHRACEWWMHVRE